MTLSKHWYLPHLWKMFNHKNSDKNSKRKVPNWMAKNQKLKHNHCLNNFTVLTSHMFACIFLFSKVNKKIKLDENHGALTCTPCVPCWNGYYNNRRTFHCQPCKNCSQENRYELLSCTKRRDAVCGDVIMWVKKIC